jgi:hypothetical protein
MIEDPNGAEQLAQDVDRFVAIAFLVAGIRFIAIGAALFKPPIAIIVGGAGFLFIIAGIVVASELE